jgi:hypothetical protein
MTIERGILPRLISLPSSFPCQEASRRNMSLVRSVLHHVPGQVSPPRGSGRGGEPWIGGPRVLPASRAEERVASTPKTRNGGSRGVATRLEAWPGAGREQSLEPIGGHGSGPAWRATSGGRAHPRHRVDLSLLLVQQLGVQVCPSTGANDDRGSRGRSHVSRCQLLFVDQPPWTSRRRN